MGRKSKFWGQSTRKLTDNELLDHISSSLTTIRYFCTIYDDGHPYIAFALATEIIRLLTGGAAAVALRKLHTFATPARNIDGQNMLASNKLVIVQVPPQPAGISYLPVLDDSPSGHRTLAFKDWWNNDLIYMGSTALVRSDPTMIPVGNSPQRSDAERNRLYRRGFVELMRNKLGAHLDVEQPEILDQLQSVSGFGLAIKVGTPTGMLSTDDGSLKIVVGPAAAMMRQITHEILVAYGQLCSSN